METVKITAKEVNELRKTTGAGMMDCKKALVEANGDFEAAIDWLRKRGQKMSAKRADREAKEGAAIAKTTADGKKGLILNLACETDFVSKNADFVAFADQLATIALDNNLDTPEALLAHALDSGTVGDLITTQIGKIGEKLEVNKLEVISAEKVIPYIHAGNKIGVLVALNMDADDQVGKDIAMQIAAMNPVALSRDEVSEEMIAREMAIGKEQAIAEGKPEAIIEKIAMGKVTKFLKENTLLAQQFVKDSKMTVDQYVKSINKDLSVTGFKRVGVGA